MLKFSYRGIIEDSRASAFVDSIINQLDMTKKRVQSIIISLEGASYESQNRVNLNTFIKKLDSLSGKFKLKVALIDYSIPLYKHLKMSSKDTQVKLFKNSAAAKLFLEPKLYKKDLRVLVYDEDEQNAQQLSEELSKYGYTIIVVSDAERFEEFSKDKTNDIIITHSSINGNFKTNENSQKQTLSLSKNLIMNLPVFMDTAVETLVSFTGLEAQKLSHTIKNFDVDSKKKMVIAVMYFSGDLDGYFALLFPREIALTAIESFLGEKIEESDNASIMDGVGEFCNVITGSAKTIFLKKDIKVIFELPKTYTLIEEVRSKIGSNNGVWIDMQLAGKPFYMFITK
ncbi:chemotaxis protein CheX [Sulfurimonas sp.]|jgi:CheY-specific phosphatase CheX|uniref:chemotaxis protein CheX n=1 Tax=Sulfurimonas sp. TaxID=2022749 RepID=UPI0025EBA97C|nr:chemotaxis protein CheX [Sulfurimonas sp.]MCK9473137.1 chemotaxis protein CheX [Sulfurimonas sp.]